MVGSTSIDIVFNFKSSSLLVRLEVGRENEVGVSVESEREIRGVFKGLEVQVLAGSENFDFEFCIMESFEGSTVDERKQRNEAYDVDG